MQSLIFCVMTLIVIIAAGGGDSWELILCVYTNMHVSVTMLLHNVSFGK